MDKSYRSAFTTFILKDGISVSIHRGKNMFYFLNINISSLPREVMYSCLHF